MLRAKDKELHVGDRLTNLVGVRDLFVPTRTRRGGPAVAPTNWYDAAVTASITTVSNAVSQWDDQMGASNLTQGTAADRPAYGGGGARSINGIVCPEWVSTDNLAAATQARDTSATWFFVGLTDTLGAIGTLVGSTSNGELQIRITSTTGLVESLRQATASLGAHPAIGIPRTATPFALALALTTTTVAAYVAVDDGGLNYESHAATVTFGAAGTTRIGRSGSPAEPWDGLIGEILFYDSTLAHADILRTLVYLMGKWNIRPAFR